MSDTDPRRRLGEVGESLARRHLEARGLEILDANYRSRFGELDLVAADERSLVFCEVKTRVLAGAVGELGTFASIGADKRRRVRRMAREWLSSRTSREPWPADIRFDVIGISFDQAGRLVELDHLEAAF